MKIIVSGLTAAGKTTLSRALARALGVPRYSASAVLLDVLGRAEREWSPEVDLARGDPELERAVDAAMAGLLGRAPAGVFDSWGLPWYSAEPAVRIWLESSTGSRARKCRVSYLERGSPRGPAECARLLRDKDGLSRELFLANWGFDLFTDRAPFDLLVDCSALIPTATLRDARAGSRATFEAVLAALVERGAHPREDAPAAPGSGAAREPVITWLR
ncbi:MULTISPECIES: hypothetical protein [Actinosynnema]|uniref:hypothetical protein n=1 Tax=Actinosynnema TaxID=40566 RepID=UPI0020A31D33|nr:hypothetical protein [Actinosynnema pretiosum]MCP2096514.1 cytidylate kinase [Actinosynnema pretiosum]